ncbi:amino acid ABC transporter permease [Alteribacillus iranensis]|uniref:Amino acid ABC transporter membrane protein 2, PAAT family n=1 Tax=Alteribacillus iranensis TaxID=930128 RepID=A0A1I2BPV1_9BACI|nr:amino acid ABC transporter permease [Alteribacillus iranensis]SFE58171.1 amino acid ABC transporter membrane protein 2, PAAT family [Alteribacillus iranensis]
MAGIDLQFALEQVPKILQGVPYTLLVTIVAMIVGLVIGTILAFFRIYRVPVLHQLTVLFVSFFRGTPLIVQLFVFFYGLPMLILSLNDTFQWGLNPDIMSPLVIALIAYSINSASYLTEVVRSAIQSVDKGQLEAAKAVGMTTFQGMYRIILPQAFVTALPNLGNHFIMLIKASALAFTIGIMDVLGISRVIANDGYRFLETYLVAALIYWLLSIIFEIILARIEKRARTFEGRASNTA